MSQVPSIGQVDAESRRVERVYGFWRASMTISSTGRWARAPARRDPTPDPPRRPGPGGGGGTGLSLPLYPDTCHVTGIDISEPMLERARTRLLELGRDDVELRRMDAHALAFPTAPRSRGRSLCRFRGLRPGAGPREMRRVVRPGGTVTVVNHFGSENLPMKLVERVLTPASQWIGFRLTCRSRSPPGPPAGGHPGERVNALGLWRLIELKPV